MKKITIGIPAFEAENYLPNLLASVQIQTIKDDCVVIISSDSPDRDYSFVKDLYPGLDIKILECEENVGPGLARQKVIDICETEWIIFIDANDILMSPFALESLYNEVERDEKIIEVQGLFYQEIEKGKGPSRLLPITNINHPSCSGRLYNVKFLRDYNIRFSGLRAMEDGEFNYKINFILDGLDLKIKIINAPIYFWKINKVNSITQKGIGIEGETPIYNWDLGAIGLTICAINCVDFCRKYNPNNPFINNKIAQLMITQYLTYLEGHKYRPIFDEQNLFNCRRFYAEIFEEIEENLKNELEEIFNESIKNHRISNFSFNIDKTYEDFKDFLSFLKKNKIYSVKEFKEIRSRLPKWVQEIDAKTKVLGEEGYLYAERDLKK